MQAKINIFFKKSQI